MTSVEILQDHWSLVRHNSSVNALDRLMIRELPCVVGRRGDCHVCVSHPTVSGKHAELFINQDSLWVRDLNSTNGTFVNGKRIFHTANIEPGNLIQFGEIAFRAEKNTKGETRATSIAEEACDDALALAQFDQLVSNSAVKAYYQPIVAANSYRTVAYEVLGRSSLYGLTSPGQMFRAAAALNMEAELSRMMRAVCVPQNICGELRPHLFLNTHPSELLDVDTLNSSLIALRQSHPKHPFTLEIHEHAVTNTESIQKLRATLLNLNINLAYDDFGVGQSRISELIETQPDCVKFDIQLIRGIHEAKTERRNVLAKLVRIVKDLGVAALAEGVENERDAEICCQIGFDLLQGYYFGRPVNAANCFEKPNYALAKR